MQSANFTDRDPENRAADVTDRDSDAQSSTNGLHVRNASDDDDDGAPVPIWMQESAKSFRYRWVPLPLRKSGRAMVNWIKGPVPPRELYIKAWWPDVQEAPLRLLDRYVPRRRHKICLQLLLYVVWALTWSLLLRHNSTAGYIKGYGRPSNIWCGASFWNEGSGCGLNGNRCRPFSSAHMAFRCPANCDSVLVLEPRVVGNHSYIYQGFVIGGPDATDPESDGIYRGDSFICQAAIHAGVIRNDVGGCGVAVLSGTHHKFVGSKSNGIQSIGFPASFPRTFKFETLAHSQAHCPSDSRWPLLAVTATSLAVLWLFTKSSSTLFFSTLSIIALHVGLVSDPPTSSNFHETLSILVSRLLPASFIAFVLWRFCARPTLTNLTAQIEKTILYLGSVFIGALNNYTFAPLIPIQRLTPHDIKSQPGAPLALAIVLGSMITIVTTQIHFIRISGQLPRYLKIYACIFGGVLILLVLPGWRLRIHHYILALVFFPGTAMQTRPALVYQGLLLGLFINGVMRWGFASIIQTPAALGEGPGGHGGGSWWGATSPNVTATIGAGGRNISFDWGHLPTETGIDGASILVDDVERWRGYVDEELFWDSTGVTLDRRKARHGGEFDDTTIDTDKGDAEDDDGLVTVQERDTMATTPHEKEAAITTDQDGAVDWGEPQFYRFAWIKGSSAGTYGGVGVWDRWGDWIPIKKPEGEKG